MLCERRFNKVCRVSCSAKRAHLRSDLLGGVTVARVAEQGNQRGANRFRGTGSRRNDLSEIEPGEPRGDCGLIVSDGNSKDRNTLHEGFQDSVGAGMSNDDGSQLEEIKLRGMGYEQRIAGKCAELFGAEAAAK